MKEESLSKPQRRKAREAIRKALETAGDRGITWEDVIEITHRVLGVECLPNREYANVLVGTGARRDKDRSDERRYYLARHHPSTKRAARRDNHQEVPQALPQVLQVQDSMTVVFRGAQRVTVEDAKGRRVVIEWPEEVVITPPIRGDHPANHGTKD